MPFCLTGPAGSVNSTCVFPLNVVQRDWTYLQTSLNRSTFGIPRNVCRNLPSDKKKNEKKKVLIT